MNTVIFNGVTVGSCGSDFVLGESNVVGLGIPDIKPLDFDRQGAHGIIAARDFLAQRTISLPVLIHRRNDPVAAMEAARQFKSAWRPTNLGNNDDTLTLIAEGLGPANNTMTFYGRPRGGLDMDLLYQHVGLINIFASFVCLDPLGYSDEEVDTGTSLTINNAGDASTDRISIVVTGNGGTPVITNVTDDSNAIRFQTALAGAATRQIDIRTKTVMNGAQDKYAELSPVNQWFDLLPGDNSITVTGASSIEITWRSAWF